MSLKRIEREKKQEQHLFYTSLKYTKTGDLIVNLLKKMAETISISLEAALQHAKKKKLITNVPKTPMEQIEVARKLFKREKIIIEMLDFYEIIRNIDKYKRITESEFRKGITLKIFLNKEIMSINMQKLEEIQKMFESFLDSIKKFLRTK